MRPEEYDLDAHAVLFAINEDDKPGSYKRGGRVAEGKLSEMVRIVVEEFTDGSMARLSSVILLDNYPGITKVSDIFDIYDRSKSRL